MSPDCILTETAGHFIVGGVYWNSEEELPFTVTAAYWDSVCEHWWVVTADLDFPCYGRSERTRAYLMIGDTMERSFPPLWEPTYDPTQH